MTITNANVKRVDAADNVVAQASDGQFKSCSEVKSAGFCWHETAEKHCALTCSANQIIHANKRALSSKGECKALNDKCDDDYPHQDSQSNCCDGLRCHRWTEYNIPPYNKQKVHNECRPQISPSPPPPVPPSPSPPPPLAPQSCNGALPHCSQPPFICSLVGTNSPPDDGDLFYDESHFEGGAYDMNHFEDDATRWNDECGHEFWTEHAASFDWKDLEHKIKGCVGQSCLPGNSDAVSITKAKECDHKDYGNGCEFRLTRFAIPLVYFSQLRAATILSAPQHDGNSTSQQAVVSQLQAVAAAMQHFEDVVFNGVAQAPECTLANCQAWAVGNSTEFQEVNDGYHGCFKYGRDYYWNSGSQRAPTVDRVLICTTDWGRRLAGGDCASRQDGCDPPPPPQPPPSPPPAPPAPPPIPDGHATGTLVAMQVSTLESMATMVGSMAPVVGFVPAFNINFYSDNVLGSYMHSFQALAGKLHTTTNRDQVLRAFITELDIQKKQITGDQSITAVMEQQTIISLSTALSGMSASLTGLNTTADLMKVAADDFQAALKAYKATQKLKMAFDMMMVCADLVMGDAGAAFSAVTKWGNKDKAGAQGDILKAVNIFADSAYKIGWASKDINGAMKKSKQPEAVTNKLIEQSSEIVEQLESQGVSLQDADTSDHRFAQVVSELNEQLPKMGTGFWALYVANNKEYYNGYLTGYNTKVNAAAQHYIDLLEAQASYGNDFVTQGTRFVANAQQLAVNGAQTQAQATTQQAVDDAIGAADYIAEYDMLQQGIIATQMTTLAMQMQNTVRQLCQSFGYQTTRLYHECVGPNVDPPQKDNVLNKLCGAFTDGQPGFAPFVIVPYESDAELTNAADAYMQTWSGMYDSAMTATAYVNNAVWGHSTSARDSPFVSLTVKVWDPPTCDASTATRQSEMSLCDSSEPASPNVTFVEGTECLSEGATMPKDGTCCRISYWSNEACTVEPPHNDESLYITRDAFVAFTDASKESWGNLEIALDPTHPALRKQLDMYDEMFVRGMSVYFEGASIDQSRAIHATLTPMGQQTTRVLHQDWSKGVTPPACEGVAAEDLIDSLCRFTNYSFVGGPSGGQSSVAYASYYSSPSPSNRCNGGYEAKPVFYKDRPLLGPDACDHQTDGPCFQYCTDLDFSSLESGDVASIAHGKQDPYNFASLFSSYNLVVHNGLGTEVSVQSRSVGIDLGHVKTIRLGMWLKTNGDNSMARDTCNAIGNIGKKLMPHSHLPPIGNVTA